MSNNNDSSRPVGAAPADEWVLCPAHKRLEKADGLECEIGNGCVACSLNERGELLQLIAPFAAEGNTEDSVTVMRRVAEFYATHVGEGRVVVSYPASTTSSPAAQPDSESKAKAIVEEYKQRVVQLSSGDAVPCAKWLEMRLRIAFDLLADPSPAAASEGAQDFNVGAYIDQD